MFSIPDTLRVERCTARVLMILVLLAALGAPLIAQEASGEANLKLPRLDTVTFLNGISGSSLLLAGILVSALTGGLAIHFLMNFLRRSSLTLFVIYRVIFGIIVIALAVFRYRGG